MNEAIISIILNILVILTLIIIVILKIIKDRKTEKHNSVTNENSRRSGSPDLEMIPGHSKECRIRGDVITKLTANYEHVVKSIDQINTNMANMWKHIRKNGTD